MIDKLTCEAIEFATAKHAGQFRKYSPPGESPEPYIMHPLRVMRRVVEYLENTPAVRSFDSLRKYMPIVAVLHDVVEDCGVDNYEIERRFGACVAAGVRWLTKESLADVFKSKSRAERRAIDLIQIRRAPREWQIIKMFDRIDNLRSMKYAPAEFVTKLYIPESKDLLKIIGAADEQVAKELFDAIVVTEQQAQSQRKSAV